MVAQRSPTARAKLVAALSQEILGRDEEASFPIASEHQLCRRFDVSRVTVRLALGDLENRGLIFRKHGKGTFAHGRGTRSHRYLGILMKCPQAAGHRPIAEMVRGAQTFMTSLRSAILLVSAAPATWRPEMASSLGGVIVVPQDVTARDLEILHERKLPHLIFTETALPGPRIYLGQREAAQEVVAKLVRLGHRDFAVLGGYDATLDATKRQGMNEAWRAADIDPASVPEISAGGDEGGALRAAREVLELDPRPTAVIATDDSLGSMLSFHARRNVGLKVPDDLSIASFHDWPYLSCVEPALSTVRFDFFAAGQLGAEMLARAALTGDAARDLSFEPVVRPGQTIGPPRTLARPAAG